MKKGLILHNQPQYQETFYWRRQLNCDNRLVGFGEKPQ